MCGPELSWDTAAGGGSGGLGAPLCSLFWEVPPSLCSVRRSRQGALEMLPTFCSHPAAPVSCACRVRAASHPCCLWRGAAAGAEGHSNPLLGLFRFLPEDGFAPFH